MPVHEARWHTVAHAIGLDAYRHALLVAVGLRLDLELQAAPKHIELAVDEKAVVAESSGVAVDAAVTGGDVRHLPGGGHVAMLALLAALPGGAGQPFAVGRVHRHAEDRAFVARGTIPAVALKGRISVFVPVHVIERAEEKLALLGPKEFQTVAAMREADFALVRPGYLVAIIAMDAAQAGIRLHHLPHVVAKLRRWLGGGSMTGGTHAGAVGVFLQQAPADVRPALPVGAFVEIAKAAIGCRARMAAAFPLVVNLWVAVAAVVGLLGMRRGVDPGIAVVVGVGEFSQADLQWPDVSGDAGDEVAVFPGGNMAESCGKCECAVGMREDVLRVALVANYCAFDRAGVREDAAGEFSQQLIAVMRRKDEAKDETKGQLCKHK